MKWRRFEGEKEYNYYMASVVETEVYSYVAKWLVDKAKEQLPFFFWNWKKGGV